MPLGMSAAPTKSSYCPDAGEFIHLNFDPQAGQEQAGARPALVLSPRSYNKAAKLCVVCPVTNQAKGYPFEVVIPKGEKVTGVVLADHVKSLSWDVRGATYKGKAPQAVVNEVLGKVKALLQIP